MKSLVLALLFTSLTLIPTCSSPTVTLPDLSEIQEKLGYSLAPTYLPEGFDFQQYEIIELGKSAVSIVYSKLNHTIVILYSQEFPPSSGYSSLFENLGLDWQRPEDAVEEVTVRGNKAYIIKGNWSAETLEQFMNPDPELLAEYTPEWDYDFDWSLYFDYELTSGERIGVILRTVFYPADWITSDEMFRIAESFQQVG